MDQLSDAPDQLAVPPSFRLSRYATSYGFCLMAPNRWTPGQQDVSVYGQAPLALLPTTPSKRGRRLPTAASCRGRGAQPPAAGCGRQAGSLWDRGDRSGSTRRRPTAGASRGR
jgi:hypothetical protein